MQENSALGRAVAMVQDLRRRCPWDRVQTRETLRPYLVEEVFELDQALSDNDRAAIRDEVADLLLHLAWQLVLADEHDEFTADQIADDLEKKMKRRHPHLFDLGPAERWETLKGRESREGQKKREGVLAGLPAALPGLLLAYRLQERAATVGFDWPDATGPLAKVKEEIEEVEAAVGANPAGKAGEAEAAGNNEAAEATGEPVNAPTPEAVIDEIGDLLFAVVNLARKLRVQPHTAMDRANRKFRARFEAVERLATLRGIDMSTAGLEKLDELWEEVKSGSRETGDGRREKREK
ncbi:MAG TPA: nucleoside triphosphate pyrophosphohydrolase [Gemmatimonadales bacterium]|nr:nucleoside triphosphate pyrophosphohydrolase [Gemmatimonadales bacterium]